MIIFYLFFAIVCFFFAFLLEENLHGKFVKFGNFDEKSFDDFILQIRKPNSVTFVGNLKVVSWWTRSNYLRQNYMVTLVFDQNDNFISKTREEF